MMKKILLITGILFAGACTIYIVFLMCNAGLAYGELLIREEQQDHYNIMHAKMTRLYTMVNEMQTSQALLMNVKTKMTDSDKEEFMRQLRTLDEIAAQIDRETIYYDEDNSVHMFFPPQGRTVAYFDEARNTPLYIRQYIRSMEQAVFAPTITKEQKTMIQKNMDLLQEEIDRLSMVAAY
ncbi:MAG: hypothetical protein WC819_02080 [Parcubacteria group bacterium]|jgi:hypothetical protein